MIALRLKKAVFLKVNFIIILIVSDAEIDEKVRPNRIETEI